MNGNIIYLPASGYRGSSDLNEHGSRGDYWSSTCGYTNKGGSYSLLFYSTGYFSDRFSDRYFGRSVRPVAEPLSEGSATINDAVWNK